MFGVLLNVGSNGSCANGRGRIYQDGTFEYLPISEERKTIEKVPTYKELGFSNVTYPHLAAHLDPEFETYTYGHVRRGFGDTSNILKLKGNDVLFFYATLQNEKGWLPYIIGYFQTLEIHDCRNLPIERIREFGFHGFENNAHLKREDPHVDFLLKGAKESRLLKKAFPLANKSCPLELRNQLEDIILTASGKKIKGDTPWFRWTLTCTQPEAIIECL